MKYRRVRRSGQFFILSAVVIALILFATSQGLKEDSSAVPSISQERDIFSRTSSIYQEINKTVFSSSSSTIEENLQIYLLNKQRELKDRGIVFSYMYRISWPEVAVNTTLDSSTYSVTLNYP
jgi:hypothetical protein